MGLGSRLRHTLWVAVPETRYATVEGTHVAYQVIGEGPFDLLHIPGFVSNVELAWEDPSYEHFLSRLASFSRLIIFDKRGTGMSDRLPTDRLPTLEERMDDVRAVLDAVGSERVALLSHSEGGNLSVLFAASYPERTIALVTTGVFAKRIWSPDYPWAPTPEQRARDIEEIERDWGGTGWLEHLVPSCAQDPVFKQRLAAYFRRSASPGAAAALMKMNTQIDVRAVLPAIRVPTLILHRTGDRDAHIEEGRWIAKQIPGARFVELAGDDHIPWVGDADGLLDIVEEFLTGAPAAPSTDRQLTSLLFTDLVDSTGHLHRVGDRAWRDLLERHYSDVRRQLARYRGRELDTAGDGFLASFDGPGRAIHAAVAIREGADRDGLTIRAGVHTGEVEIHGPTFAGIAVHVGARIAAQAQPGEILVSRTVRDLVAGSGLVFVDRGVHTLKGVPDDWELYAVQA
jgi:pimeloyl-ACP methyl ester carboxylesterase